MELLFVCDSIEHNVEIASNRFDLPPEVQALVEQGASRDVNKGLPQGKSCQKKKSACQSGS